MMLMWLGSLLVVLVCIDMGIKEYIENSFSENEERQTRMPKIVLRKVYNRGLLLNALDRYPGVIRAGSAASGMGVLLYDAWLLLKKGKWFRKLGMVFVTAGAVSNIYDRLARGKVIDYFGVKSKSRFLSDLTANLADIYVTVGALIITVCDLGCGRKNKEIGRKRNKKKRNKKKR